MQTQQLLHEIEVLPPELQKQVSDFVALLRKQQQKKVITKRTVGEYSKKIIVHEDFDAPLDDDFWFFSYKGSGVSPAGRFQFAMLFAATPPGSNAVSDIYRGCRSVAQPPANRWQPFGLQTYSFICV